jgi:RNA polymerase sigma-70 factor (ECF subfamily)
MTAHTAHPHHHQPTQDTGDFKTDLLALTPFLRAFARSLCGSHEGADDLAQEALVKAWQSRDSFLAGTNLKAWLFTILRNQFYSDRRRAWRQAPWDQEAAEKIPGGGQDQGWSAELSDTARALRAPPTSSAKR